MTHDSIRAERFVTLVLKNSSSALCYLTDTFFTHFFTLETETQSKVGTLKFQEQVTQIATEVKLMQLRAGSSKNITWHLGSDF